MTTAVRNNVQSSTQPGAAGGTPGSYRAEPFVREAGTGPGVVLLHANASTGGQWRSLMDLLAPHYRVLAPDLYGSGRSPDWPSDRVITLRDEVDFIEPVMARAGSPLVLGGPLLRCGGRARCRRDAPRASARSWPSSNPRYSRS